MFPDVEDIENDFENPDNPLLRVTIFLNSN